MDIIKILQPLEIFQGLGKDQLGEIAQIAEVISYPKNSEIFHEHSIESDLYIVVKGRVQVNAQLTRTEKTTMHTILQGKLFGEFSFIDQKPRSATAVALVNSDVIKLSREKMMVIFSHSPAIGYQVMSNLVQIFARRIRQTAHELKTSLMWEQK